MSHNRFGHLLTVTTFGESHGKAIGCVIDGCPPGLTFTLDEMQTAMDRRRPGTSRFVTQRRETDRVECLSGVLEQDEALITTGTSIALLIRNQDQRSKDYNEIADLFRPGHADYTYQTKYGLRDHRGGGRSSARETAARVAAGVIARKVLGDIKIRGALVKVGPHEVEPERWDDNEIDNNPFFCPDARMAENLETYLADVRKRGSSIGAVIEVRAEPVPVGLGAPVYGKLDSDLAAAMMSINAVKAVEIGRGFDVANLTGEENADEINPGQYGGPPDFTSNHAGGILGGISTGQPVVCRFAVKPTSSILTPRQTINTSGQPAVVRTKGRHDPCVGIRAVPVGEAMMALVLADHVLRHRGQTGQ